MVTTVVVPESVLEEICTRAYVTPEEICGAVLRGKHIVMTNAAAPILRKRRFTFDPQEQLDIWTEWGGEGDLVIYHSHPASSSSPSVIDEQVIMDSPNVFFMIVSVRDRKASVYRAVGDSVHELVLVAGKEG